MGGEAFGDGCFEQELAYLSFDTASERLNHVELRSSCSCFLTFVDLIFISSRNMKGRMKIFTDRGRA